MVYYTFQAVKYLKLYTLALLLFKYKTIQSYVFEKCACTIYTGRSPVNIGLWGGWRNRITCKLHRKAIQLLFCMRKIGETPMSGIGFSHFLPASAEKFSNNVKKVVKISVYMR